MSAIEDELKTQHKIHPNITQRLRISWWVVWFVTVKLEKCENQTKIVVQA